MVIQRLIFVNTSPINLKKSKKQIWSEFKELIVKIIVNDLDIDSIIK